MIEVRVVDEAVVAVLGCGLGVIDILSPTTHPSQSSPLSPGKASMTDMTTCNGYIHFF